MICSSCGQTTDSTPCSLCNEDALLERRYRLETVLGHGAMGTTYRAIEIATDQPVAVKELPLRLGLPVKTLELFRREARVLRELHHPGIPSYLEDFVTGEGKHRAMYIVQEFVEGCTLEAEAERHRYNEEEVLAILDELLEILEYIQTLSPPVIHRDIKPHNIMRRASDRRLFLTDFGSVRDALKEADLGGSTVAGTFGYMAPEQFMGDADPRSDLYALGAMAVALLTRKPPHTMLDHQGRILWQPHIRVGAPVAELLTRLLEQERERRVPSARAARTLVNASSPDHAVVPSQAGTSGEGSVTRRIETTTPLGSSSLSTLFSGAPSQITLEREINGVADSSQHSRLVATIERTLGLPGQVSTLGDAIRWRSDGPSRLVHVSVEPRDRLTHVTIRENLGQLAGGYFGGLMGGVGGGIGGGLSFVAGLLGGAVGIAAWIVVMIVGSYLLARTLFRRAYEDRTQRHQALLDALAGAISGGPAEDDRSPQK